MANPGATLIASITTIRATTANNITMRFISAPFCRGAEGRPTIPPRVDQRGQLRAAGASAYHSIAVFLTTFFANFLERRQREVRRLDTLQATRLWGSGGATR